MLKEIEKAVEALKVIPREYRALVLAEADGKTHKKPGPPKGWKKKTAAAAPAKAAKKAAPKAAPVKAAPHAKAKKPTAPVKVSRERLEKLAKLKARAKAATAGTKAAKRFPPSVTGLDQPVSIA